MNYFSGTVMNNINTALKYTVSCN